MRLSLPVPGERDTLHLFSYKEWQQHYTRRMRQTEALRWGASFAFVAVVIGAGIAWMISTPSEPIPVPDPPPAAIAIDMAPEPVSMPTPPTDVAVGPQQTLSQAIPQPDPPPKITAPPSPAPNPPIPVPKPEKPRLQKKKSKPSPDKKLKTPDKLSPALETTAPPSSEAPPSTTQAAPAAGASSSQASQDPVTWQGALLARLEKYKRYPAEAQSERQQGTVMLHFSMDRKGHVLAANISGSSGFSLLDEETLALVHRAEPFPVPPDTVQGNPITLTVPVEFYIHQNDD